MKCTRLIFIVILDRNKEFGNILEVYRLHFTHYVLSLISHFQRRLFCHSVVWDCIFLPKDSKDLSSYTPAFKLFDWYSWSSFMSSSVAALTDNVVRHSASMKEIFDSLLDINRMEFDRTPNIKYLKRNFKLSLQLSIPGRDVSKVDSNTFYVIFTSNTKYLSTLTDCCYNRDVLTNFCFLPFMDLTVNESAKNISLLNRLKSDGFKIYPSTYNNCLQRYLISQQIFRDLLRRSSGKDFFNLSKAEKSTSQYLRTDTTSFPDKRGIFDDTSSIQLSSDYSANFTSGESLSHVSNMEKFTVNDCTQSELVNWESLRYFSEEREPKNLCKSKNHSGELFKPYELSTACLLVPPNVQNKCAEKDEQAWSIIAKKSRKLRYTKNNLWSSFNLVNKPEICADDCSNIISETSFIENSGNSAATDSSDLVEFNKKLNSTYKRCFSHICSTIRSLEKGQSGENNDHILCSLKSIILIDLCTMKNNYATWDRKKYDQRMHEQIFYRLLLWQFYRYDKQMREQLVNWISQYTLTSTPDKLKTFLRIHVVKRFKRRLYVELNLLLEDLALSDSEETSSSHNKTELKYEMSDSVSEAVQKAMKKRRLGVFSFSDHKKHKVCLKPPKPVKRLLFKSQNEERDQLALKQFRSNTFSEFSMDSMGFQENLSKPEPKAQTMWESGVEKNGIYYMNAPAKKCKISCYRDAEVFDRLCFASPVKYTPRSTSTNMLTSSVTSSTSQKENYVNFGSKLNNMNSSTGQFELDLFNRKKNLMISPTFKYFESKSPLIVSPLKRKRLINERIPQISVSSDENEIKTNIQKSNGLSHSSPIAKSNQVSPFKSPFRTPVNTKSIVNMKNSPFKTPTKKPTEYVSMQPIRLTFRTKLFSSEDSGASKSDET